MTVLDNSKFFNKSQHGFRNGRSTTTQMIECLNDWTLSADLSVQTDVVYFDFSKAFDCVSHHLLFSKIKQLNLHPKFFDWLKSFLVGRTFSVKINNEFSKSFPATSGVPQGGVLSPVLFSIFVNDLPDFIKSEGVTVSQFADDVKIYATVPKYTQSLQHSITKLVEWANLNNLPLNSTKTKIISLGSKTTCYSYLINGTEVSRTNVIRDLGFYVSPTLDFDEHWKKMISRANSAVYVLFKAFSNKNPKFYTTLYKSHIRSLLEYGTPVTSPFSKKLTDEVEKVQKLFTRKLNSRLSGKFIRSDDVDYLNYDQRLKKFELASLSQRRSSFDIKFLQKILLNKTKLDWERVFSIKSTRSRSKFRIDFRIPKKKLRKSFFICRVVPEFRKKLLKLSPKSVDRLFMAIKSSLGV
jgi:hypothetical protein